MTRKRRPPLDAIVTHHVDGYRSGVARFNELLAERLGVPLLRLDDPRVETCAAALLSFKVRELPEAAAAAFAALVERIDWRGEVFLHEYADLPLERRLVERARLVHCGNHEILERLRPLGVPAQELWSPGLILDERPFRPAEISVFSFGMAHKMRLDMFERLRGLLQRTGRSYALYVSAANHETASLRDAEVVFRELHEVFPDELFFLGNLSDVAVYNHLVSATFFAAFFERGVRANNGSVGAALDRGAVVVTNLDEHSPPEFAHMDNLIDIARCDALPLDPLVLKRLGVRAMETGRARGWDRLVERLR